MRYASCMLLWYGRKCRSLAHLHAAACSGWLHTAAPFGEICRANYHACSDGSSI